MNSLREEKLYFKNFKVDYHHFTSSEPDYRIVYRHLHHPERRKEQKQWHFIFLHGVTSHQFRERYTHLKLLQNFSTQAIVSTIDLLGHGLSGGPRAYVKNYGVYREDMLAFLSQADRFHEKEEEVQYIFIGQSLGGLLILDALIHAEQRLPIRPSACILANPAIEPSIPIPPMIQKKIGHLPRFLGKLRLPSYHPRVVSSDYKAVNSLISDEFNDGYLTISLGVEILKLSRRVRPLAYYINTPCLFLFSKDDCIVNNETGKLFAKAIEHGFAEVKEYAGKHELLNELVKDEVVDDITKWVKSLAVSSEKDESDDVEKFDTDAPLS